MISKANKIKRNRAYITAMSTGVGTSAGFIFGGPVGAIAGYTAAAAINYKLQNRKKKR